MPMLEYLMVYTQSGLPIYSKCYGLFCKTAFQNPELLTGFLSAIETIPPTLSDGLSLESIKMGPTQMRFNKTTPDGHSIVVGLGEDRPDIASKVFDEISEILLTDEFKGFDWSHINSDIMRSFEDQLLNRALVDALGEVGGFADECSLGDQCPIHTNAFVHQKTSIWGAVKSRYAAMKQRMMAKMKSS